MLRSRWIAGVLGICAAASVAQVGRPPQNRPIVKSGDTPFYPPLANMARIEGDVHLRVKTDGSSVESVSVESGQPMLARAAQENVKTWKFEPHEPTSFVTLFSYHILTDPKCSPDKSGNGDIHLELPSRVEITTNARSACYNADDELDLSEPLRVFLTGCEIDGAAVPCERLAFDLHSGSLTISPTRFKESEKKQGFVVPKEFRTLKSFWVSVETESGGFTLPSQNIGFLKGKWHIGIDHAPFKEETPIYNPHAGQRCAGFIVFEWGEPEIVATATCK